MPADSTFASLLDIILCSSIVLRQPIGALAIQYPTVPSNALLPTLRAQLAIQVAVSADIDPDLCNRYVIGISRISSSSSQHLAFRLPFACRQHPPQLSLPPPSPSQQLVCPW
ncbi:hypothetical protein C8F04DRAFT_1249169 [Mycena alexandri]|uniref:Uncharacterized protein n=1 Tax=Mycena alexandri TaxID=1745969 RepID=A0AAD6XEY7_9AGAR|nr:hypothetical protein C8F04DRAFT_1249169 [Mycena alexandri]